MTIQKRIVERTIVCNRCGTTTLANEGPRGTSKPVGWVHLQYIGKLGPTQPGYAKPNVSRKSLDLCPTCAKDFDEFMAVTQ